MKYRTINNHVARRLVRYILNEQYHHFVTLLYNFRNGFEDDVINRLLTFCIDLLSEYSFEEFICFVCSRNDVQYIWFRQSFYNIYHYGKNNKTVAP